MREHTDFPNLRPPPADQTETAANTTLLSILKLWLARAGWSLKAGIASTAKMGNGLAVAAQAALNTLVDNGTNGKILER